MKKLIIEGGRPLAGTIQTAGAKNAVLPMMAAGLLSRGTLKLRGAPRLKDVRYMTRVLRDLGAEAEQAQNGDMEINASGDIKGEASWELVRRMRGSLCVMGPMLARGLRVWGAPHRRAPQGV